MDTAGRLSANAKSQLTPNVAGWPKNFTIETEFVPNKVDNGDLNWWFEQSPGDWLVRLEVTLDAIQACAVALIGEGSLGKRDCVYQEDKPNQLNLWFQEGRARVYLNGERLIDVNQVDLSKMKYGFLDLDPGEGASFARSPVRIAESAPDFSQTITSSGRYVTHGITFDTNSDRLKPESVSVIRVVPAGESCDEAQDRGTHRLDRQRRRGSASMSRACPPTAAARTNPCRRTIPHAAARRTTEWSSFRL